MIDRVLDERKDAIVKSFVLNYEHYLQELELELKKLKSNQKERTSFNANL